VPEVGAVTPGEEGFFVEDRAVAGPQGVGVDVGPGELLAGPKASLVAAPEVVILGLVYGVVLAGHVVESKAPAHRLLIQGVGVSRQRVGLSGLILALSPDRVLYAGQL
jgi:hypothetical protein